MNQSVYDYDRIAEAINFITKNVKDQPSLETIAQSVHVSPFHLQRMFTDWAGVSPKKFVQYMTVDYAKQILNNSTSQSLFDTAEEIGLSGTGRLHDLFVNIEGMTPGEYKNGGEKLTIRYSIACSQFGKYIVASTGKGICNLFFFDHEEDIAVSQLSAEWPNAKLIHETDADQEIIQRFFGSDFNDVQKVKLHLKGTPFQIKVWEALLRIPEGSLTTYGKLANGLQQPNASRAVGTAIGSNQVGFIIPCHRVIKSVGAIGQFRWGTNRKKAMIGWEASKINKPEVAE